MASEPERPIEKLLRDAARKRREETPPGFELHPATRRLLQGEVARQYPQQERSNASAFGWLWRISPRLRWGLAGAALCIFIAVLVIPSGSRHSEERLLVRNERVKTPPDVLSSAPPAQDHNLAYAPATPQLAAPAENRPQLPAAPGARSDAAPAEMDAARVAAAASLASAKAEQKTASDQPNTGSVASFQDKSLGLAAPTAVFSKDNTPLFSNFASTSQQAAPSSMFAGAAQNPTPPPPLPEPSAPAAAPASAVANSLKPEAGTDSLLPQVQLVQRFVRNSSTKTYSAQNAHTPEQGLLVSFQVEQNGTELRVRDQDGSVYLGYVQSAQAAGLRDAVGAFPSTAAAGRTALRKQANAPTAASDFGPMQAQNYFFRVAGTNQTLKLPVIFTGNLSNPATYGLTQAPLSGARISGRVRVGAQREFEVLASPAPESKPGDGR